MKNHVLVIRKRSFEVVHPPGHERHPKLLCERIEHAAGVFLTPTKAIRRMRHRARGRGRVVTAMWVELDEGNLHPGRRLSDVEHLLILGRLP